MALWFVLGLMTVAAAFAVLWPLGRAAPLRAGGRETEIYRDQLAELDRDRAIGLIGPNEADAAQVEISRRLLAAARSEQEPSPGGSEDQASGSPVSIELRRAVAVAAMVALPLLSGAAYLHYGSPGMASATVESNASAPPQNASLETLVAHVEQHLGQNPKDGRGWEVLAPVLFELGRYDDAVTAFRNVLAYSGENAERHANLGEAMSAAANGVITAEAKAEFEKAHALDANDPKARFFLGMAAQQDGRMDDAAAIWRALLQSAPPDAPWRATVQHALASVTGGESIAPQVPSDDMAAAASSMNDEDRTAFIHSMVDRLATRLKQNGDDFEGWIRLVRAYMVLGERDKAQAAANDARTALGSNAARLQELNEQLKQFGLGG